MVAFFDIPLNLPHAGKIASRIARLFENRLDLAEERNRELIMISARLVELLWPVHIMGDNPEARESQALCGEVAELGRRLVSQIEKLGIAEDRLGQCVRNLFECLELGEEGAIISLRAGENPNSVQRPI